MKSAAYFACQQMTRHNVQGMKMQKNNINYSAQYLKSPWSSQDSNLQLSLLAEGEHLVPFDSIFKRFTNRSSHKES